MLYIALQLVPLVRVSHSDLNNLSHFYDFIKLQLVLNSVVAQWN